MNILLCSDNNYAMHTGVLMHSICANQKGVEFYIFVDMDFSVENRQRLCDIAYQYGCSISIKTVTPQHTVDMPVGKNNQPVYITKSAYSRLFAATLLPDDIDRVIYLDSDVVIRGSLQGLWEMDIEGYAVAVGHDMAEQNHIYSGRLPYNMVQDGYFNSGVLLINLSYWRKNDCMNVFFEIVKQYQSRLILHDQDVLNIAFHDKKKWFPVTYNYQNGFLYKETNFKTVSYIQDEIEGSKYDPIIVHFSTWDKPWKLECFHPFCKDWRKFFFRSVWKGDRLIDEEAHTSLKKRIRNYLVRHCLYVPDSLYVDI